ncbi:MAG TPA: 3-oxoacyl-[acyl-carrier-protein] synthase III C-terminal domain-containing protein [Actinophytocola sp.]|uniref:3-oxoacyl-[acyl-carrier-protein] synthase III C-terminal domain-containing protein n=1 Tax=Actinophytocola sp. TaxID=1872138 RepID=UPI002DB7C9D4|nr:3-oxoacyl-[acyl-carrier-protein] synthase III C-terminal domain-containing protein [Actinophytocola sp.]HEU5470986.1 3-oxoacyl-[acyl-carrier-protein] synthase III C-terminal domain-containing protein [Actinophytocola sp.]
MGTIASHPTLTGRRWPARHRALRLAVRAADACLDAAGCPPGDLDLVVNAGLYRDRNLAEPALAALVQDDIGAHPEDPHPGGHGTFSFDVANGVCGVLTALQVVDGFLRSGAIRRALVVASDTDPGHGLTERFPFAAAGGALMCRWADGDTGGDSGLGPFRWTNLPDGGESFRATLGPRNGRNRLTISVPSTMDTVFAAAAGRAARDCLTSAGVTPAEVDLVVAAPARPGFTARLATELDLPAARIAVARDVRIHTPALIAALRDAGPLAPGSTVLLVAAGAGVTGGATLYRVPA